MTFRNENQFAYQSPCSTFLSVSFHARSLALQIGTECFRRTICIHPREPAAGYEWVGWRNDTYGTEGKPVEMTFEFDSVRNFSAIVLHTNNMFTKDVQASRLHEIRVLRGSGNSPATNTETVKSF